MALQVFKILGMIQGLIKCSGHNEDNAETYCREDWCCCHQVEQAHLITDIHRVKAQEDNKRSE